MSGRREDFDTSSSLAVAPAPAAKQIESAFRSGGRMNAHCSMTQECQREREEGPARVGMNFARGPNLI